MGKRALIKGILIGLMVMTAFTVIYASSRIVGVDEGYDYLSEDIFERIHALENRYPEIIRVIEYGRSVDDRPLYAIQMTKNAQDFMEDPEYGILRTHYYIDGGNHSRETVNPPLVLRMVEDYARDYYGEENISGFDVKKILEESVLHFLPLPNPDGYNLVKIGLEGVQTREGMDAIKSVDDTNYSSYKANLRGVDLNRNYPSPVYDLEEKEWVDLREKNPGSVTEPAAELYGGPYGASEPEVKYKNEYILNYDFRQFLTFHSRGEVIFWNKYYFPDAYNDQAKRIAEIVHGVNGYRVGGLSSGGGSGYFSDFAAGMTFKPVVTVETTPGWATLPTEKSRYSQVYDEIRLLPLYIREEGEKTGYHDYKLYRDGKYIRDFPLKAYAEAKAEKFGGEIRVYSGSPHRSTEDYRIAGSNRYHTAHLIAWENDPSPSTVIIVRGDSVNGVPQVVDGLTASGLAGRENAQILMVSTDRIPNATRDAISDLKPEKAIVVGGEAAVSEAVVEDLQKAGLAVERIFGSDRSATAAEVAVKMGEAKENTGIIVNGFSEVDSLVAGPLAHQGYPILMVNNPMNSIPEATLYAIELLGIEKLIIVGGTDVVSESIESQLDHLEGVSVMARYGGKNRIETSILVGKHESFSESEEVSIVNGWSYVDAVAASTLGVPVLYFNESSGIVKEIEDYLATKTDFRALGGSATIADWVVRDLIRIMGLEIR